jgi:1,2-phenylacetyl-CoA epoxidase catalytic subunit
MAQDQLGQARVLYGLIQEQFPHATSDLDDETRVHRYSLSYLDEPFSNWATFVVANLLIGAAVTTTEEALGQSRFAPLRTRMPKMLDEERFHRIHAEGWFKQLQRMEGQIALQQSQAVEEMLPQVLCWFGDAQHAALADAQIITEAPGDLRERYLERVAPLLEMSASKNLIQFHEHAHAWSYTDALPWGQYDAVTRRVSTDTSQKRING